MATGLGRRVLRAAGATDVGRVRQMNEDRYAVDPIRGVFMVVDGIGGQAAGDRAAETAIAAMTERLSRETGAVTDRVREAITIANNEIHRLAGTRPDWQGMACVLTLAVVDGDQVVVGHVGDSRLYRVLDGRLEKITPDHSPIGEREDAHEISEAEAMRHPRRNEVYRDVGSEPHALTDTNFAYVAAIDFPASAALLICSDGLTDLVPAERIRQVITTHAGAPEVVVRALVDAANDAGGKDNVTVIYVEGEQVAAAGTSIAPPVVAHAAVTAPANRWLPALATLLFATLVFGALWWTGSLPEPPVGAALALPSGPTVIVRSSESISAALALAQPGGTVIVEPGEYRERLTLKDNIRVVSRVPRGATLRLPGAAGERDAAVMAVGVMNAELVGFRIVGDSATPLGVGVLTRDAIVRLVDLEVSGAASAALDLGAGDGAEVIGSELRDNPGAAIVLRAGATTRLAHNTLTRNATSERTTSAVMIETGATPRWIGNVFLGMTPQGMNGLDDAARAALERDNWFVSVRPVPTPPPARRGGRGR